MALTKQQLGELPSPFYRVAVKALIFDGQGRLAIVINEHGEAEIPGGGWEHGETLKDCLRRELDEEMHAVLDNVSPIEFVFRGINRHGWHVLRVVVRANLKTFDGLQPDDDMQEIRLVTKDEFLRLKYDSDDSAIVDYTDTIWGEIKE